MNQTSQYIFNLYHYLLNLRDTMEYTIDREHTKQLFDQRKEVLTKGLEAGSALGNFLDNNKEQGDKIREKINQFFDEVYADGNTILVPTADGKIRVDHTQHIKIFEGVTGLTESLRDILYGYMNYARQRNESEAIVNDLITLDDRLYRLVLAMLVLREFEKSFAEFQKVMGESQGKPTPQSNFIVQNEISKLAGFIRFSRQHIHVTDNETLDLLDEVNAVIEMTEGRRDRRDGKSFKDIFDDINKRLNDAVSKAEPVWREAFNKALSEMIQLSRKQASDNEKADA